MNVANNYVASEFTHNSSGEDNAGKKFKSAKIITAHVAGGSGNRAMRTSHRQK